MRGSLGGMRWYDATLLPLGFACATATLAWAQATDGGSGAPNSTPDASPSDVRAPARGERRLYVDPETGERTAPPPGTTGEPRHPSLDTSTEGLVNRPLPGGGGAVDLQGRFKQLREGHAPPATPADDAARQPESTRRKP